MTRLKVTPICAAIMLMSAYAAPAVIKVTGLRQSLRSAEDIKRDAAQVVDAINADDIGKFPDCHAGDALQRVAGVQVGRDRGETGNVTIRGLPDVATTLDGAITAPKAMPTSRARGRRRSARSARRSSGWCRAWTGLAAPGACRRATF